MEFCQTSNRKIIRSLFRIPEIHPFGKSIFYEIVFLSYNFYSSCQNFSRRIICRLRFGENFRCASIREFYTSIQGCRAVPRDVYRHYASFFGTSLRTELSGRALSARKRIADDRHACRLYRAHRLSSIARTRYLVRMFFSRSECQQNRFPKNSRELRIDCFECVAALRSKSRYQSS